MLKRSPLPNSLASLALVALLAPLALEGCSSSKDDESVTCEDRVKVGGACPGVTEGAITADGIACTATIAVSPDDIASKASAAAGTCLQLGAGSYPAITLGPGVSIIGKGQGQTTIAGIKTTGVATGATIRGVRVGGTGIAVSGGGTLTIDKVVVSGTTGVGIAATGSSLTLTATTIEKTGGFGLLSACRKDCTPDRIQLALRSVLVRQTKSVGVWVHGRVDAVLDTVEVSKTGAVSFQYGRGLELAEGASVDAKNFASVDNNDLGIFVDGGTSVSFDGFTASRNVRGVQIQGVAGGGKLSNFEVLENFALGVGIARGTKGLIVQGGLVASTQRFKIPVNIGGMDEIGDGINWIEGSQVEIASTVKIQGSGRNPVIIDSTSSGKFEGTLAGGDERTGLIVQGGLEPSMPAGITVAAGVKTNVLTKDKAMPLATAVELATAP